MPDPVEVVEAREKTYKLRRTLMPERIEITKMKQNSSNREYVIENVKQEGALIEFASEELRDDKEVVLKAVNAKPLIVKYASLRLRQDIDVAKAAIGNMLNIKPIFAESYPKRSNNIKK